MVLTFSHGTMVLFMCPSTWIYELHMKPTLDAKVEGSTVLSYTYPQAAQNTFLSCTGHIRHRPSQSKSQHLSSEFYYLAQCVDQDSVQWIFCIEKPTSGLHQKFWAPSEGWWGSPTQRWRRGAGLVKWSTVVPRAMETFTLLWEVEDKILCSKLQTSWSHIWLLLGRRNPK